MTQTGVAFPWLGFALKLLYDVEVMKNGIDKTDFDIQANLHFGEFYILSLMLYKMQ